VWCWRRKANRQRHRKRSKNSAAFIGDPFTAWKQAGARTFQLFHVGWTPGGIPGFPQSVRFELRELNTVSVDRNSFDGTYDQKFFDADGNIVLEDMGTLHGTRLSVDQFADQLNATASK
jgi:hypothetical protein